MNPSERIPVLQAKTLRSLLQRARAVLAIANVDITRSSLLIALLYVMVEQAKAAQVSALPPQDELSSAETNDLTEESLNEVLDDLRTGLSDEDLIDEVSAQADTPMDPAQAARLLRALIEEELQISGQAQGLTPEQVLALEPLSNQQLPQASTAQDADPSSIKGVLQKAWPSFDAPGFSLGDSAPSPMALLGGALLAGLAGGSGGASTAAIKIALYSMGIVADGYISGATVELYAMVNGREQVIATTTTNEFGQYQFDKELLAGATKLVARGGTDVSTGLKFNVELSAPASVTVVNPLTTLIQSYIEKHPGLGLTADQAMQAVKTALGITGSVNLLTVDPIAQAMTGSSAVLTEAISLQAKAAQIANLLVTGAAALVVSKGGSRDSAV